MVRKNIIRASFCPLGFTLEEPYVESCYPVRIGNVSTVFQTRVSHHFFQQLTHIQGVKSWRRIPNQVLYLKKQIICVIKDVLYDKKLGSKAWNYLTTHRKKLLTNKCVATSRLRNTSLDKGVVTICLYLSFRIVQVVMPTSIPVIN